MVQLEQQWVKPSVKSSFHAHRTSNVLFKKVYSENDQIYEESL